MTPTEAMPVPYLATTEVYRRWLSLRLDDASDAEAWRQIAATTPRSERRRMARTPVAGAHGQPPLTLSVPVQGGGSMLKRGVPEEWRVSMHGRWQPVHNGALEAAYSATPFYPHLMPSLREIITGAEEGMPFLELSAGLHRCIVGFLGLEETLPQLRESLRLDPERMARLASEKSVGLHTDLTFLDVIFKMGRESVFTLLPDRFDVLTE